ncbi:MAG: DUF4332 domain-containing protein [Candidatus Bathyarchaeota archaeon]|nr:MAG: DUF4332 domain-containing protein [Candidatus Bathyarchaeota archaeon]
MDEKGFTSYMKEKKNPQSKIDSYTRRVKRFEEYLKDNEAGKSIGDLTTEDLKKFVIWSKKNGINAYLGLWGIREYLRFLNKEDLAYSASFVMQMIQLEKFKLKDFMTANQDYAKKLAEIGVKTASRLLEVGKTIKERKILAEESGIPEDAILKFVKLANLARAPGHMKKRACLYYESGLDTFDKIANQDPETMIKFLAEFILKTGFNGSPPLYGDARFSVENSKRIPRIIEY